MHIHSALMLSANVCGGWHRESSCLIQIGKCQFGIRVGRFQPWSRPSMRLYLGLHEWYLELSR